MKNDNRGFTLIELVICMVIFSIVVVSVFGFMLASARSYSAITNRLNLELDSQLAMNHMENYIMDCNTALDYVPGTNTLYLINEGSSNTLFDIHIFQFEEGNIFYIFGEDNAELSNGTYNNYAPWPTDLLAENVTEFSVSYFRADGTEITTANDGSWAASAVVTMTLTRNSVAYSATKTIALRNNPTISVVQ